MMAKGMSLLVRDTLTWNPPADAASATVAPPAATSSVETLPADHPDARAVRRLLDANGLTKKQVDAVSVVENGRVVKLFLQEAGVKEITPDIGQLTELRLLHAYGDRTLGLPLLTTVSPALAKCTKLEELLLTQNSLDTLPPELATLKNIKTLSIAENPLTTLPAEVKAWAEVRRE
jgi:hypothetical protein